MDIILAYSLIIIAILYVIMEKSKWVIQSELKEWCKMVILAIANFMIYCLLQYSYGFIRWTIRFNKFHQYPHKNPFCMLVIVYCIIFFILLGAYYVKNRKEEYGIAKSMLYLLGIHLLAILLVMFFSPIKYFFF